MIKVIIVDDDELCISVIEDMVNQLDEFSCIGTFLNALDAYNFINSNDVDVIFLDVEMPKMGGIELLKNLKISPLVVMITSHDEFMATLSGMKLVLSPLATLSVVSVLCR